MAGQGGYQQPGGFGYTDPTHPPPQTDGGNWAWDALKGVWNFISNNAGSIAGAAGSALQAYETEQQTKEKLAEQKAEFGVTSAQQAARDAQAAAQFGTTSQQQAARDAQAAAQFGTTSQQQAARDAEAKAQFGRTTGDTEAQAAVRAQTQLDQSPLADKAQALILARMGVSPGAFQPRDITRGLSDLSRNSVAPGANVAATLQKAASGYKPGQGGVDTSVLRSLIAKLTGSSGLGTQPTQPTGPIVPPPPPPPDITPHPITPKLPPLKPLTTGPSVTGPTQPLPPKIPFNNPVQPPTPTQPVIPTTNGGGDDTGGGDQEPDPNDPTEILKRKMQLVY